MAVPEEVVWKIEEHTLAKHMILRRYLQAWFPIMASRNRRIAYVDAFAGPGVYLGGEPGSPIIALKCYLEHAYRDQMSSEFVFIFIDDDTRRVECLKGEVGKLGPLPENVNVQFWPGSYEEVFSRALDKLQERGAALAPTFAFIDPFGYSQAPMRLSGRFLQFERCEVLIYVPLPWIHRFVSRAGQERALSAIFGGERWREAVPLSGKARVQFLHDLFRDELKAQCGLEYVRSFEIVTAGGNGYNLFFGSKNLKGLEKMKEAMWKADPAGGERFRDSTSADQLTLFDQADVDTRPLAAALRRRFAGAVFTAAEAEDFALVGTPYLKTHVRARTLRPLENDGALEIVEAPPARRRGTYPPGTKMRFVAAE